MGKQNYEAEPCMRDYRKRQRMIAEQRKCHVQCASIAFTVFGMSILLTVSMLTTHDYIRAVSDAFFSILSLSVGCINIKAATEG